MTKHSRNSVLAVALGAALIAPLAMAQNTPTPTPTQDTTPATNTQVPPYATPKTPASPTIPSDTPTAVVPNDSSTAPKSASSKTGKTNASAKSWAELDIDKDGNLSKSEAAADPGMKAVFAQADTNGDGVLTPDEYRAYYAKYQASAHK